MPFGRRQRPTAQKGLSVEGSRSLQRDSSWLPNCLKYQGARKTTFPDANHQRGNQMLSRRGFPRCFCTVHTLVFGGNLAVSKPNGQTHVESRSRIADTKPARLANERKARRHSADGIMIALRAKGMAKITEAKDSIVEACLAD